MSEWLDFVEVANPDNKTRKWHILSKGSHRTHILLGRIFWFPRFRSYCFEPNGKGIVYDVKYLQEIIDHVAMYNKQHKSILRLDRLKKSLDDAQAKDIR